MNLLVGEDVVNPDFPVVRPKRQPAFFPGMPRQLPETGQSFYSGGLQSLIFTHKPSHRRQTVQEAPLTAVTLDLMPCQKDRRSYGF